MTKYRHGPVKFTYPEDSWSDGRRKCWSGVWDVGWVIRSKMNCCIWFRLREEIRTRIWDQITDAMNNSME